MQNDNLYLLDTHAFVWLIDGKKRIKNMRSFNLLKKASKLSGLRISVISIWEIALLEVKGRIKFTIDINDWVDQALNAPGVICEPLSPHVAVTSAHLPGEFHGDPADRIIVATARYLQCPVVTADKKIQSYAHAGYVRIVEL